ncbi:MAG: hypothetical protein ACHQ52_08550, partial [Candidatus Eisenbacteria bacterium]
MAVLALVILTRVIPGGWGRALPDPKGAGASRTDYAGSESCRDCHPAEFARWRSSHHAEAERPIGTDADRRAFDPPRRFEHGTQHTELSLEGARHRVVALGPGGRYTAVDAERVIGEAPLRQFLVRFAGGRWQ